MSQKVSLKTDYHIPESWDLNGNIGKDPIAQSLMVRLEAGALASSVPARWYQRVVLTPVINLDKKFEDFHAQHQSEYPTQRQNKTKKTCKTVKLDSKGKPIKIKKAKEENKAYVLNAVDLCENKIPKTWELDGNLARDPIAISLLARIEADSIAGKVVKPPAGLVLTKLPRHDCTKINTSKLQNLLAKKEKSHKIHKPPTPPKKPRTPSGRANQAERILLNDNIDYKALMT